MKRPPWEPAGDTWRGPQGGPLRGWARFRISLRPRARVRCSWQISQAEADSLLPFQVLFHPDTLEPYTVMTIRKEWVEPSLTVEAFTLRVGDAPHRLEPLRVRCFVDCEYTPSVELRMRA